MREELKPCPFCEGEADFLARNANWDSYAQLYSVSCDRCDTRTGEFDTKEEAAAFWNTRHVAEQVRVKPLVWEHLRETTAIADTALGQFHVYKTALGYGVRFNKVWIPMVESSNIWDTIDEAKAAAQADYERRIRAALEPDERAEDERNKELIQAYTTGASDMRRRAAASVREWQAFTKYAQERISDEMADEIMALDIVSLTDDTEPDTVTGWEKIGSAPLETPILAIRANGQQSVILWGEYKKHNQPKFTHWMPLPCAPKKEGD